MEAEVKTETPIKDMIKKVTPTKKPKLNKDGLIAGAIVSDLDYWKLINKKR